MQHIQTFKNHLRELYRKKVSYKIRNKIGITRTITQIKIAIKCKLYSFQGKQVVHFLHIEKTGGSAIKEALKYNLANDNYAIILHKHQFRLKDVPQGHKCFFFIRDPISRFVSAFYHRKRKSQPKNYVPWIWGEKIAFNQFSTPNELALALSSEDIDVKESAIKAMKQIILVRTSYLDWFHDKDYFISRIEDIIFIGCQEKLECDFEKLKNILLLPDKLKLPQDNFKANRSNSDEDKHLDDKAKQNLMSWYAQDYEFIKLCQEKSKLMQ